MTHLQVSRAHFPVTVLGPGRRIGLWLQGCTLGCAGCISRDTWDPARGRQVAVGELADWCIQHLAEGASGLTVSGGEPFQQAAGLEALLGRLREAVPDRAFDFLVYSGYSFGYLGRHHARLLGLIDVVVTGPFVADLGEGGWLRGSANQEIHCLSALGEERFGEAVQALQRNAAMQVAVTDSGIRYIGIPRDGDMARLENIARRRGIELGGASWLA